MCLKNCLLPALATCMLLTACDGGNSSSVYIPPDEVTERATATNNPETLNSRVTTVEEAVSIDSGSTVRGKVSGKMLPGFVHESTVSAPEVDGEFVQATTVVVDGGKGIVSYNTAGEPYRGAIDTFIGLDSDSAELVSSLGFKDTDVSQAIVHDSRLYAAEAASTLATGFSAAGSYDRLELVNDRATLTGRLQGGLSSFAATSIAALDKSIYVTTGSTGKVYRLDSEDNLRVLTEVVVDDARWVHADKDGKRVLVLRSRINDSPSPADDGELIHFDENLVEQARYMVAGVNVPEAKNTVQVRGDWAFIAAGPAGVHVMDLNDGRIVRTFPIPSEQESGVSSELNRVANSAAAHKDLLVIANGEAGIYVVQAQTDFKDASEQDILDAQVLGRLKFSDPDNPYQSANHIDFDNGYIFVAAGQGGLQIVRQE